MKLPTLYAAETNRFPIDMTLSTNPLGCSSRVIRALHLIRVQDISEYPRTDVIILKIAEKFCLPPSRIILGNGSEQLIKLIVQTFITSKSAVWIQQGTFDVFTKECLLVGAAITFFDPFTTVPPRAAKMIFLCNPINPTGEVIPSEKIRMITLSCPKSLIVIDEANGEYSPSISRISNTADTNVIVLKTFSKVLGLAGLRLGFATSATSIIRKMAINQQPFPISAITISLALAALEDENFINKTKSFIIKERQFLRTELLRRNIQTAKSVTNNLFLFTPLTSELITQLNRLGVGVVPGNKFPGLNRLGFRISIKDRQTNRMFLKLLDKALSCIKNKNLLRSKGVHYG